VRSHVVALFQDGTAPTLQAHLRRHPS